MSNISYKDVDLNRVFERPQQDDNLSTRHFRRAMAKASAGVWIAELPTNGDRIEALIMAAAKMFHSDGYSLQSALDHVNETLSVFYRDYHPEMFVDNNA
jgi:hypothetical protein